MPHGGIAIDFMANTTVAGQLEDSSWHLIDFVSTGNGLLADGLTVQSEADLRMQDFGISLMSAVTERMTMQVNYRYSRFLIENIDYTRAGALEAPNLRTDGPPYERTADAHSIGVRLRLWLGTD